MKGSNKPIVSETMTISDARIKRRRKNDQQEIWTLWQLYKQTCRPGNPHGEDSFKAICERNYPGYEPRTIKTGWLGPYIKAEKRIPKPPKIFDPEGLLVQGKARKRGNGYTVRVIVPGLSGKSEGNILEAVFTTSGESEFKGAFHGRSEEGGSDAA